jgi:hypothetical protein
VAKLTFKVKERGPGLDRLVKELKAAQGSGLKVGVLGGEHASEGGTISMVELAAVHEFGVPERGIPERSFLRASFDKHEKANTVLLEKLIGRVYDGRLQMKQALGLLGTTMAAQTKSYIADGNVTPPDSPYTVAKKGSDRPLVDTGALLNSITYKVTEPGGGET